MNLVIRVIRNLVLCKSIKDCELKSVRHQKIVAPRKKKIRHSNYFIISSQKIKFTAISTREVINKFEKLFSQ